MVGTGISRIPSSHGSTNMNTGTKDRPPCPYRGSIQSDGTALCVAGESERVDLTICRQCPIPEALSHPRACLYLVLLREDGEARFACRWRYSWSHEPAPKNWRDLCFCPYWFPRPRDEKLLGDLATFRARVRKAIASRKPPSR